MRYSFDQSQAWLLAIATICSFATCVYGFPSSAVSCAAGTEALLQPSGLVDLQAHGILNQIGTGSITDFGLKLELNGLTLDPNTRVDFETGQDHSLSLIAEGDAFTGFLIRMDSVDGTRTLNAILPVETIDPETNQMTTGGVKVAPSCEMVELVAGVSHKNALTKQQLDMVLNMEDESEGLELDVTIVIETSIARNISHWYYSRYILNAVRPEGQDTPAPVTLQPTPSPTTAPVVTEVPTTGPTEGADSSSPMMAASLWVPCLLSGALWSLW